MSIRAKKRYQTGLIFLLIIILAGVWSFGLITNSRAAVTLVSKVPGDGQYLDYNNDPVPVQLIFSDKVKLDGSTILVTKEDGIEKNVTVPALQLVQDGKGVLVNLGVRSALGANRYTVNYSILAEADGQPATGNFQFFILPQAKSPLEFDYIFSTPSSAFTTDWKGHTYPPLATIFFFLALAGTIVGNFVFFYGKYFFKSNLLNYTLINRASRGLAIVASLGFGFFLCRLANLQPFNARFFLYLTAVIAVVYFFRGLGYMLRTYPKARVEWREVQAKSRRKEVRESEEEAKRREGRKIAPAVPPTGSIATGSGDAGGEEGEAESRPMPASIPVPRGNSTRGDKRRAKKRDRR